MKKSTSIALDERDHALLAKMQKSEERSRSSLVSRALQSHYLLHHAPTVEAMPDEVRAFTRSKQYSLGDCIPLDDLIKEYETEHGSLDSATGSKTTKKAG